VTTLSFSRADSIARDLLAAAEGPVCVAVVDDAGAPIVVLRSDGAARFSVDVATAKARTAAEFGTDTGELEALWAERPVFAHSLITQGGWFVGRGGVPLRDADGVVGGIGVSGNDPDHEEALARAAASTFTG
jgi:uncharacterized protein GlcG (DUF336 family)